MANEVKISLTPPATFPLKVAVPVLGGASAPVVLDAKQRRTSEYSAWLKGLEAMSDRELFDSIVVGWQLEDPFTPENVDKLLEAYPKAAQAVGIAYVDEYSRVRSGAA